jgi:hypothetical protein
MDQLKNAGGMRLIRKKNVADSIASYDLQWQRAEFWREAYVANLAKGKDLLHKIFNAKTFYPVTGMILQQVLYVPMLRTI